MKESKTSKTIGLLGGMSWESTLHYYQLLNQVVNSRLGDLHSAKIVMISIDFQPLERLMREGKWQECAQMLSAKAVKVEQAGADCLLICTNTLHKVAEEVAAKISIPLLHIADAAGTVIQKDDMKKVGLLGTRFTMEEDFYRRRLAEKFGIEVVIPSSQDRDIVDRVIFDELCRGKVKKDSRDHYLRIIDLMHNQGAQAVVEGCTEINMLISQEDTDVPLYDTTSLHVKQAIEFALTS